MSFWIAAVAVGDESLFVFEPVDENGTMPSSILLSLAITSDGLNCNITEYTVDEFGNGSDVVTALAVNGSHAWHSILLVASFAGRFADTWDITIDGSFQGTFGSYYSLVNDYESTFAHIIPYIPTARLRFSAPNPSGAGFRLDDLGVVAWSSLSAAESPLTSFATGFEPTSATLGDVLFSLPVASSVETDGDYLYYSLSNVVDADNTTYQSYFQLFEKPDNSFVLVATSAANFSTANVSEFFVSVQGTDNGGGPPAASSTLTLVVTVLQDFIPVNFTSLSTGSPLVQGDPAGTVSTEVIAVVQ